MITLPKTDTIYLHVPCEPLTNDFRGPVNVRDADGRTLTLTRGVLCILGDRLGIRGTWQASSEDGTHRVRFADGQVGWFRVEHAYQWERR